MVGYSVCGPTVRVPVRLNRLQCRRAGARVPARSEVACCRSEMGPVRSPHLRSCKCSSCVGSVPNVSSRFAANTEETSFPAPLPRLESDSTQTCFFQTDSCPRVTSFLTRGSGGCCHSAPALRRRLQVQKPHGLRLHRASAVTWSCKWLPVTRISGAPSRSFTVADLFGLGFLPVNDLGWAVRRGSEPGQVRQTDPRRHCFELIHCEQRKTVT